MTIYHIRDLDPEKLEPGDTIEISGLSAAKIGPYLGIMLESDRKKIEARGLSWSSAFYDYADKTAITIGKASPQGSDEEARSADTASPPTETPA